VTSLVRGATLSVLTILFLVVSFSPAFAKNNGHDKVSSDLQEQFQNGSLTDSVRLIVNLSSADPKDVAKKVKELGGKAHRHFKNVDEMVLELPLGALPDLADMEGLDYIAPDREVRSLASHIEITTGASQVYAPAPGVLPFQLPGLDTPAVAVAVLDSGIDAEHFDLKSDLRRRRVVLSLDFTGHGGLDDPYGHGTHVAGIIAGDGTSSIAVGRDYAGMAPTANLINFKVLDEYGRGYVSSVVAAIDQAITLRNLFNIKVINLSIAAPPIDSYVNDPMCRAIERATRAGIVVVVSAGNFGQDLYGNKVYGSITSPGISPSAITVGATNTRGTDTRSDDTVAPFSSHGPTLSHTTDPVTGEVIYDNLAKPDLVAPGTRVVSLERSNNLLVSIFPALHVDTGSLNSRSRYMVLTGTSMATAVVSGAVALMVQANPGLTPNQVKAILMYSAQIMDGPDLFEQGAGMLNVEGAVRLAKSVSHFAFAQPAGASLMPSGALPMPAQTTVAGEPFAWSQSLIWGRGMMRGDAMLTTQQLAYAQSLIWGIGRHDAWGQGVSYYDGLYDDSCVVFGQNNQWNYITWNPGTSMPSGLIWSDRLYSSGLIWFNRVISNDFFDVSSSSLIWGVRGYAGYDMSLIWGLRDAGLIWGLANEW